MKVSDIRNLRINVNPTNLIPLGLAKKFWRKNEGSGLKAWDLITPNRASSNIGEFAILLPGEENVVLTKEVFIIRVTDKCKHFDNFYLLWAFCLKVVRDQWQRITLMQTNREDVGDRYREIIIPLPKDRKTADTLSKPFKDYFTQLASSKKVFHDKLTKDKFSYLANVYQDKLVVTNDDEE